MFNRFISKKPKPRVFLGTLAVVPRTGLKNFFKAGGVFSSFKSVKLNNQ